MLGKIKSDDAGASVEADALVIKKVVETLPNGFDNLDEQVCNHLRRWLIGATRRTIGNYNNSPPFLAVSVVF